MVTRFIHVMGKRQVKNESALKEIRLPEEGELFGRVLKMMGGENVMIKCDDNIRGIFKLKNVSKRSDKEILFCHDLTIEIKNITKKGHKI